MASFERVRLAYNNLYIVEDAGATVVIDTGPDYRGAREAITAALRGRTPELVIATHGHLDHAGLGAWWQSRGVPVALGAEDYPQALGEVDADIDLMEGYIGEIGAPLEIEADVVRGLEQRRGWTKAMRAAATWAEARDGRWPTALLYPTFRPLREIRGAVALPAGLTALPAPGHTPGNLVVTHAGEGWLFSGDQLLPEITPTPAIQFSEGKRFPSLPRFVDSLRSLAGQADRFVWCFPGHGEPFANVGEVVAANMDQAQQRGDRLKEAIAQAGSASVYELAEQMYPRALRRRFWQIIATLQGHLDLLQEAGAVTARDGRWSSR